MAKFIHTDKKREHVIFSGSDGKPWAEFHNGEPFETDDKKIIAQLTAAEDVKQVEEAEASADESADAQAATK